MNIFKPGVLTAGMLSGAFLEVGVPVILLNGFNLGDVTAVSELPVPLLILAAELKIRVAPAVTSQRPPLIASNALFVVVVDIAIAGTYNVPKW